MKDLPEEPAYCDAASGLEVAVVIAVVDGNHSQKVIGSVNMRNALIAEEAVIALACTGTTDNKAAVRNFGKGLISKQAASLLRKHPLSREVSVIWVQAHEGLPGNEAAHCVARDVCTRAAVETPLPWDKDPLITYKELSETPRLGRKIYPPLDRSQTECRAWRKIQAKRFFPYVTLHSGLTGDPEACNLCNIPLSQNHLIWQCPESPGAKQTDPLDQVAWESYIRSPNADVQKIVIRLVEEAYSKTFSVVTMQEGQQGGDPPSWLSPCPEIHVGVNKVFSLSLSLLSYRTCLRTLCVCVCVLTLDGTHKRCVFIIAGITGFISRVRLLGSNLVHANSTATLKRDTKLIQSLESAVNSYVERDVIGGAQSERAASHAGYSDFQVVRRDACVQRFAWNAELANFNSALYALIRAHEAVEAIRILYVHYYVRARRSVYELLAKKRCKCNRFGMRRLFAQRSKTLHSLTEKFSCCYYYHAQLSCCNYHEAATLISNIC